MKPTPLVLLSLGVLASAGPVPEGDRPVRDTGGEFHALAAPAEADHGPSAPGKLPESRRKSRALRAQQRRFRRKFRRDGDMTDGDDRTDDENKPAPKPKTNRPKPANRPKPNRPHDDTDNDDHHTTGDDWTDKDARKNRRRVRRDDDLTDNNLTDNDHTDDDKKPVRKPKTATRPKRPQHDDTDNDGHLTTGDEKTDNEARKNRRRVRRDDDLTDNNHTDDEKKPIRKPKTAKRPQHDDTDNDDHFTSCDEKTDKEDKAACKKRHRVRRDDNWTEDDRDNNWTQDDDYYTDNPNKPAPITTPAPVPKPSAPPQPGHPHDDTDNDGHYTSCDEWTDKEACTRRHRAQTTRHLPGATTKVKPPKPTAPVDPYTDTDNPDWETDCDSNWSDEGEYERCKARASASRTLTHNKPPKTTGAPVPKTTYAVYPNDDTDNPDHLTDCDSSWSDEGEYERCKARTASIKRTTALTRTQTRAPATTTWSNQDYLTDCDSSWSDDGESQRCSTRVISVTQTTATDAEPTNTRSAGSSTEPDQVTTNSAAGQADSVRHAIIIAGLVAAGALVL
ncbi:hypothetical protein FDECE_14034 [Fusarium decemcellulare]|nr:hypothetical protein FDECE_14034 [Fusarium decemcellulare]